MSGLLWLLCTLALIGFSTQDVTSDAQAFLDEYQRGAEPLYHQYAVAQWEYNTNISDENAQKMNEAGARWSVFYTNASEFSRRYPAEDITDNKVKLQLIYLGNKGAGVLPSDKYSRLNKILNDMSTIYSTQTVCKPDGSSCLAFEPGLDSIMLDSTDYHERLWAWEGWRVEAGKRMRKLYEEYVDLENEAAVLNGYDDYGDYWRGNYETLTSDSPYIYTREDVIIDVNRTFEEILPLYQELHAYVRSNLQKTYGYEYIDSNGGLPAHLLGDMWGRFWTNLYPLVVPFPDRESIDVTPTMVAQGWTVERMFKEAENFAICFPLHVEDDKETEINFLLKQALTIVGTLPFTYMLELWRWKVDEDVHIFNETRRISFYFYVTMPQEIGKIVPKPDVEQAVRMSKGRINNAFLLDEDSLEFLGIPPTLSPPAGGTFTVWLVVFGVVAGIIVIALVVLLVLGQRDKKKKRKEDREKQLQAQNLVQTTAENDYSLPAATYETVGEQNKAYEDPEEPQTAL
ncbi:hypothetical protein GDO81_006840 [Engystomops pustulosus]|uniref:Angiotensin-converting enzyme n=1 Tax=Engystomops pustulosus TaxID=76066 RepID=A0AAV7D1G5_ENGPU|nr:hypothetical protein GDO81_006840 [Engystomops pustulosus]